MKFIRLNFTVEGQTEEKFIKETLELHLRQYHVGSFVRLVATGKAQNTIFRGGMTNYAKARNDIWLWLKEDKNQDARFTTFFDLYRLPKDFPGYDKALKMHSPYDKVEYLEQSMAQDINDTRFLPYIQLHEFETFLFCCPKILDFEYFDQHKAIQSLKQIAAEYKNPEYINDTPGKAPSARIIRQIPQYKDDKVSVGAPLASLIGIDKLRNCCPHFDQWLKKLEQLPH